MKNQVLSLYEYCIQKLDAKDMDLYELSRFIITENYKHHGIVHEKQRLTAEIKELYLEEYLYSGYSEFYVARNTINQMIGTIRIMKWDTKYKLPIQKIFGINPLNVIKSTGTIWHIGRFAVSNSKRVASLSLFKQLLIHALTPIYQNNTDIIIAECDSKLIRVLSALGIQFNLLGSSLHYLGSATIPVYLTQSGIINFFNKYKNLTEPLQGETENLIYA